MRHKIPSLFQSIALVAALGTGHLASAQNFPSNDLNPRQKAEHLLFRAAFGPDPTTAQRLLQGESAITAWLEEQLYPERISEPELEAKLKAFPSLSLSVPELFLKYPAKNPNSENPHAPLPENVLGRPIDLMHEMAQQKVLRAIESKKQLQEVLVDFWFNHFNVDATKDMNKWLIHHYELEAIRPHVFGKFHDLLLATARHPAMLRYLDNYLNVKQGYGNKEKQRGINENYARELLELHTLGVDGGYTQKDVIEVARAFTGWGIEAPKVRALFRFAPQAHDNDPKTVLGRKINAGGEQDGLAVLELLASHPETARFLATKLCRRFVADNPPAECVQTVSARFLATSGDLRETYRALFRSPSFWSKAAYKAKIKRPFEFTVSALRALGLTLGPANRLPLFLHRVGEDLYRCPPPTGYKDIASAWVSSGALVTRINFGLQLTNLKMPGLQVPDSLREFLSHNEPIPKPEAELTLLYQRLSLEPLPEKTRQVVLREVETMQMEDGERRPLNRARLLGLLIGTPEFQRR